MKLSATTRFESCERSSPRVMHSLYQQHRRASCTFPRHSRFFGAARGRRDTIGGRRRALTFACLESGRAGTSLRHLSVCSLVEPTEDLVHLGVHHVEVARRKVLLPPCEECPTASQTSVRAMVRADLVVGLMSP